MSAAPYPEWAYYPQSARPPVWVPKFLATVTDVRDKIESVETDNLTSDSVLAAIAPGLHELGFAVEVGKQKSQKIRRPVLFGPSGTERVAYEVDAVHDELGIVVEVEAGRGARGNAVYRDLIRASLIVGVRYLALGVMKEYRHQSSSKTVRVQSFGDSCSVLDAIYASGRLKLPFEGVLLFGY
jgi:hypothetical protein